MNHGPAEPAVHWSAPASIPHHRTAACARTRQVMRNFLYSPGGCGPHLQDTAVLEIARETL
jgi:hypothetical protein